MPVWPSKQVPSIARRLNEAEALHAYFEEEISFHRKLCRLLFSCPPLKTSNSPTFKQITLFVTRSCTVDFVKTSEHQELSTTSRDAFCLMRRISPINGRVDTLNMKVCKWEGG